jgi:hypothetical protein
MRDIRSDLNERVKLMERRIKLADDHCERVVKQVQKERDAKVADLKSMIAMMDKLIELEQKEMGETAKPAPAKLTLAAG